MLKYETKEKGEMHILSKFSSLLLTSTHIYLVQLLLYVPFSHCLSHLTLTPYSSLPLLPYFDLFPPPSPLLRSFPFPFSPTSIFSIPLLPYLHIFPPLSPLLPSFLFPFSPTSIFSLPLLPTSIFSLAPLPMYLFPHFHEI